MAGRNYIEVKYKHLTSEISVITLHIWFLLFSLHFFFQTLYFSYPNLLFTKNKFFTFIWEVKYCFPSFEETGYFDHAQLVMSP